MHHYALLRVHRNPSKEDLDKARRRLAREHHPDRGGSHAEMVLINEAYETLLNDERRYLLLLGFQKMEPCPACRGRGYRLKQISAHVKEELWCEKCEGLGGVK